ncbi:T-cell surface glycoprotein CD3 gamma chain-like isoform X2 [Hemicordylus capensis]|nr:T-cell surface glycoprotein CD3 gamma chain-like isoform X2 [Hemicordylus capensis]XP_053125314.1 T-cell surface glycoprotein CD3 gamma chain-like isoform X2 [Hemicordylus capensis]
MASCRDLFYATVVGLLFKGIFTTGNTDSGISVKVQGSSVTLVCKLPEGVNASWTKDGLPIEPPAAGGNKLPLGSALDDPQGIYRCNDGTFLQVFFRMCQTCIHLDAATVTGLVVGNILATVFLAVAVYKIAAQEPGRLSRASDKQSLLASDQLYQPLGERSNGEYSRLGVGKARRQ